MSKPKVPKTAEKAVKKRVAAAAERALAEAEARRKAAKAGQPQPTEIDGRTGPEPIRYGDWEVKGLAKDF